LSAKLLGSHQFANFRRARPFALETYMPRWRQDDLLGPSRQGSSAQNWLMGKLPKNRHSRAEFAEARAVTVRWLIDRTDGRAITVTDSNETEVDQSLLKPGSHN
jgi:hypothetical protein